MMRNLRLEHPPVSNRVRRRPRLSCAPTALYRLGLDSGFHRLGNVERGDEDPVGRFDGRRDQSVRHLRVRRRHAARGRDALFYGFFVSVAAGMTVIQDDQWRLGELIHATPLRPGEYIWAKFTAVLAGCGMIVALHLAAMLFFNHVLPNSEAHEIRGPLHVLNYLMPALLFSVPTIVFLAGLSFAVGEWSRRPILVFVLPVAIVLVDGFFLWEWSPNWLDPRLNDLLMWIDPSGFRWLNENWLKVDRGVSFYNNEAIPLDRGFVISRVVLVGVGFLAVALARFHFAGDAPRRYLPPHDCALPPCSEPRKSPSSGPAYASLASLGMTTARPGLLAGAWQVARVELTELRSSPGLYLFTPLILLQTLGPALVAVGFLDTPLLITSGTFAVSTMGNLAVCLCLLLLFYTVESLERERSTRLAAIAYATPIRTQFALSGQRAGHDRRGTGDRPGRGRGRCDRPLDPAKGRPGATAVSSWSGACC